MSGGRSARQWKSRPRVARFTSDQLRALDPKELYQKLLPYVFKLAWRLVGGCGLPHDAVHDIVSSVVLALPSLSQCASLDAWLYSVVRRQVFAGIRKDQRYRRFIAEYAGRFDCPSVKHPDAEVCLQEELELTARVLTSMPPKHRDCFFLAALEGCQRLPSGWR